MASIAVPFLFTRFFVSRGMPARPAAECGLYPWRGAELGNIHLRQNLNLPPTTPNQPVALTSQEAAFSFPTHVRSAL